MVNWFIERARRTPYFHLDGYMKRWWLVPYRQVIERLVHAGTPYEYPDRDGTGPVSFWRRPLAWLFQRFDIAIRVHEILRSDRGRDPHDHPWPYLTVILKGGYWEERYDNMGALISRDWYGPGSAIFRRAGSWHRLILPEGQVTTTLFITGRKQQTWGFNVDGTKVPYKQYEERT